MQTQFHRSGQHIDASGDTTDWHLSANCTNITWSYCHARGCPKRVERYTAFFIVPAEPFAKLRVCEPFSVPGDAI